MLKIKQSFQFQIEHEMVLFYVFETVQEASSWKMRNPHTFHTIENHNITKHIS